MFKNPKFIKISELYNKIVNDFGLDEVYITNFYHPRNIKRFLSIPVEIRVETYNSEDDDEIIFNWAEETDTYKIATFLGEYNDTDENILDSIINALEKAYNEYTLINNEVDILLKNIEKSECTSKIIIDILNKKFKDETSKE